MKTFTIEGKLASSQVMAGASMDDLATLTQGRPIAILTDNNVLRLHGGRFPEADVVAVEPGEESKTLNSAHRIFRRLVELTLDRDSLLIGIGGGVICDLAGFVGATFLRGIDFGFVPTTLLAQVDASIGGKNAVNLDGYKNLIGTFTQPEFVLCDPSFLLTLPIDEVRFGLCEALKAGVIGDAKLFDLIETSTRDLLALNSDAMDELIERAIAVKVGVVSQDERDKGVRHILNFGHTFGHALEKASSMPHGKAVAVGMATAAKLSATKGLLMQKDADRIVKALDALGLPTHADVNLELAVDAMRKDKKRYGRGIEFIMLEAIGKARICRMSIDELAEAINDLR